VPFAAELTPSQQALLGLSWLPQMGAARLASLVEALSQTSLSLEALWFDSDWQTLAQQLPPWGSVFEACWAKRFQVAQYKERLTILEEKQVWMLFLGGSDYPSLLAETHRPPQILFGLGNPLVLSHAPSLGVVGTRRMSTTGREGTDYLLSGLKELNPVIVSGLADGIDTVAHQQALALGLPTVAVMGTGIDEIYPLKNQTLAKQIVEQGGALISEYPPLTPPQARNFPPRNRIITGLSQAILLVECPLKSGAMITAKLAVEENRHLMAMPHHPFHPMGEGPLSWIRQGATPVWKPEQVRDDIQDISGLGQLALALPKVPKTRVQETPATRKPKSKTPSGLNHFAVAGLTEEAAPHEESNHSSVSRQLPEHLSESQKRILQTLSKGEATLDDLVENLNLSTSTLQSDLTLLELEGLVALWQGSFLLC
jgi:DNA processing protein